MVVKSSAPEVIDNNLCKQSIAGMHGNHHCKQCVVKIKGCATVPTNVYGKGHQFITTRYSQSIQ